MHTYFVVAVVAAGPAYCLALWLWPATMNRLHTVAANVLGVEE